MIRSVIYGIWQGGRALSGCRVVAGRGHHAQRARPDRDDFRADEYRRLKKRDREVLAIEDFTDADIEAIRRTEPSERGLDLFNDELPAT